MKVGKRLSITLAQRRQTSQDLGLRRTSIHILLSKPSSYPFFIVERRPSEKKAVFS